MCVIFEDELFEVEECSFVRDFLTDLNGCFPGIFGVSFSTIGTLLICYNVFDIECLLKDGGGEGFFLDGEFYSNSTRVRFCPYETCID